MRGHYLRMQIAQVDAAAWSTTKHTKRQHETLVNSIRCFGQLQPLIVREISAARYEVVDGSARLEILREMLFIEVDVLDLGAISDSEAREIHLVFNLTRGKPSADGLADALQFPIDQQKDDQSKALKEIALLDTLPISRKGVDSVVAKLRSRGKPAPATHNPKVAPGWIDFKFKVDPGAARVCDDALTHVESTTGCKRGVAFERICADYLAGAPPGGQP